MTITLDIRPEVEAELARQAGSISMIHDNKNGRMKRSVSKGAYILLVAGMLVSLGLGISLKPVHADNSCPYYDTNQGTYQCSRSGLCPAPNGAGGSQTPGCTCDSNNFCANAS